jgi:hypothetical protein
MKRLWTLIFLLSLKISISGCAQSIGPGINEIDFIKTSKIHARKEKLDLNLNININTEYTDNLEGYKIDKDLSLTKKALELSLIDSINNLGIFKEVKDEIDGKADLILNIKFHYFLSGYVNPIFAPIVIATGFFVTPEYVKTTGRAEVALSSSQLNFTSKKTFVDKGKGWTLTGIAGNQDADADSIEEVSSKIIHKITEFILSKYPDFRKIHIAKRLNLCKNDLII